ncbi:MAG: hypothetical protein A2Z95_03085 [Gallionellales bacterium GWA2_60_18]|nr:MAG: hypothetical protein A2Z95_03085 [Gallionellales bacterium GWA2_60_18]
MEELPVAGVCFVEDAPDLPESLAQLNVAMGAGDEARVAELLARGAERVLLGDIALDSAAVKRLVEQHGSERIGIWMRAARVNIRWTMADEAPNAGFKCMFPTVAVAGWEMLKTDGSSADNRVEWWIGQVLAMGVSMALVSIDMEDKDMNICATLILDHGDKLWFSPRVEPDADLEPWVKWGQVRQLVLPSPNARDEAEMARICASAMVMVEGEEEDVAADTEADAAGNGGESAVQA